jgi:pimeloyl-ACP methyl ester carboxylesterase
MPIAAMASGRIRSFLATNPGPIVLAGHSYGGAVITNDHAIPPQAERAMAARAHAHTVEIASSHVAMTSHPDAVTDLILTAARNR